MFFPDFLAFIKSQVIFNVSINIRFRKSTTYCNSYRIFSFNIFNAFMDIFANVNTKLLIKICKNY